MSNNNPRDQEGNIDPNLVVQNWMTELISDIIGALCVGPSLFLAHSMAPTLWTFYPSHETDFLNNFLTHPPCEIRFNIHRKIIEDLQYNGDFQIDEVQNIQHQIDTTNIESDDYEVLQDRARDIDILMPVIDAWFDRVYPYIKSRIDYFSQDDWKYSVDFGTSFRNETDFNDELKPSWILNGMLSIKPLGLDSETESEIMNRLIETITDM